VECSTLSSAVWTHAAPRDIERLGEARSPREFVTTVFLLDLREEACD
jgi:hypothetical protein